VISPLYTIGINSSSLEHIFVTVYNLNMNKIQRILLLFSIFACALVLFGTAVAFISGNAHPGGNLRRADPNPQVLQKKVVNDATVFSDIGTMRCSTADNPPVPLVITPYFRYAGSDSAFYEELVQKTRKIRLLISSYMLKHTKTQLLGAGEQKLKADLLELINKELVLGNIDTLYFSDYIFLE